VGISFDPTLIWKDIDKYIKNWQIRKMKKVKALQPGGREEAGGAEVGGKDQSLSKSYCKIRNPPLFASPSK
jgi:hypothetical protein